MRLPEWLKTNTFGGTRNTKSLLRRHGLSTVCEEARCPNKGHCFSKPTATFLILGDNCTRHCGFCSVKSDKPGPIDSKEPERVADAAESMALNHVVITSVTRDDLADGGAEHFANTVKAVRNRLPKATIEILTPDFRGDIGALKTALSALPNVFNHNMETVPRLYRTVRPQAHYKTSLLIIQRASELFPEMQRKSGFMLGLGEREDEITVVLKDLREAGCDFVTIGQYLRPGRNNLPVKEYIHPDVFEKIKNRALDMGFTSVASAPLVRSSMNAEEMVGKSLEGKE